MTIAAGMAASSSTYGAVILGSDNGFVPVVLSTGIVPTGPDVSADIDLVGSDVVVDFTFTQTQFGELFFSGKSGNGVAAQFLTSQGPFSSFAGTFAAKLVTGNVVSSGMAFNFFDGVASGTGPPYSGGVLNLYHLALQPTLVTNGSFAVDPYGWISDPGNLDGYIGVEFSIDASDHYGWIKIRRQFGVQGGLTSSTILEWAYEDVAGAPITVPEPGTVAGLAMGATALLSSLALRRRRGVDNPVKDPRPESRGLCGS